MELHFTVLAILLLTLVASYAIRRAEEEMIERRDFDRRPKNASAAAQDSHEATNGTKARA
jgi:hypothetical protein